mmetsp:Transcript_80037/g.207991  ORF Transcript_80037/g.207991 Transcript_80037/m.207991 type:complete len:217 (+) Transcript_80037:102-752(+)
MLCRSLPRDPRGASGGDGSSDKSSFRADPSSSGCPPSSSGCPPQTFVESAAVTTSMATATEEVRASSSLAASSIESFSPTISTTAEQPPSGSTSVKFSFPATPSPPEAKSKRKAAPEEASTSRRPLPKGPKMWGREPRATSTRRSSGNAIWRNSSMAASTANFSPLTSTMQGSRHNTARSEAPVASSRSRSTAPLLPSAYGTACLGISNAAKACCC